MSVAYFLLFCEEDLSYSVVPACDVVFKGKVNINDEVKFFFDSTKTSYIGKVVDLGGK